VAALRERVTAIAVRERLREAGWVLPTGLDAYVTGWPRRLPWERDPTSHRGRSWPAGHDRDTD